MEVIGDLTDEQASLCSIAPHLHGGHIAVGNNLADEKNREVFSGAKIDMSNATIANMSGKPIWSKSERKFLRNARNRFGHGYNTVDENEGLLIVKTRQKEYRYTLTQLAEVRTKIKLLVEDRFGMVTESWTECSFCGAKAYRDDVLECGHADYSGLDLSKPALGRKPRNGILHVYCTIGRLDEIDMSINRRSRAELTVDGFASFFESSKNSANAEIR